jgi:hypothetical protein
MAGWMALLMLGTACAAAYGVAFYINLIGQQIIKLRLSLDSISPYMHCTIYIYIYIYIYM